MEVRLKIPDEMAQHLMKQIGVKNGTDLVKEALTLLDWAADKATSGNYIVAADEHGKPLEKMTTPGLLRARKAAKN